MSTIAAINTTKRVKKIGSRAKPFFMRPMRPEILYYLKKDNYPSVKTTESWKSVREINLQ